jgi:putative ABC transport system permease protein
MNTLWQDIRFAIRTMAANPGMTAVAVLSIGLGIGANTTIFTVINAVFLNPLPVRHASELVAVYTTDSNQVGGFGGLLGTSRPNYRDLRDQNDTFSGLAAYTFPLQASLSAGSDPQPAFIELATGNYFDVLGVQAARGRTFSADEDLTPGAKPVVILSHGYWKRRFGGEDRAVGSTVKINGVVFTVIGVAPEGFKGVNALFSPDGWAPSMMYDSLLPAAFRRWFDDRRALLMNVAGRLRPGVTMAQAESQLKAIFTALEKEYPQPNKGRNVTLRTLTEATIFPGLRQALALGSAVLMTIVGLVLLIACFNVANLLLARATSRRQEIAMRLALGASRGRLVRQLLTESVLLALAGGVVGLLLAPVARDGIWALRPAFLAQNFVDFTVDVRVLAFATMASLLTGLIFGLAPALQAVKPDVVTALKEETRSAGATGRRLALRNILVVGQVALSLVTLVVAGLFLRSLGSAHHIDPGFDATHTAIVAVTPGQAGYNQGRAEEFYRLVAERAVAQPSVRSAAWSSSIPLTGNFQRTVVPEGKDPDDAASRRFAITQVITPGYFEAIGIPVLRGRPFTQADRTGSVKVAVVNEAMAAALWPNDDAVGKRFSFYGDPEPHEVVGIAKTSKYNTLGEDPQIAAYIPLAQNFSDAMVLVLRTDGDPSAALGAMLGEIRRMDREVPLNNPASMSAVLDQSLWAARLGAILLGAMGGLALVLASVGLYGVMSYSVGQRQKEIGVRMALGASQSTVLSQVLRQALTLVAIGLAIGLIVAIGTSRLVSTLLYGVTATDPVTFVCVSLLLIVVGFGASFGPAFRASRVDPIVTLR